MGGLLTVIMDLLEDFLSVIRELVLSHKCEVSGCGCKQYSDNGIFNRWWKKAYSTTYVSEVIAAQIIGKPLVCDGCGHVRESHGSLRPRLITADAMPNGGMIYAEMQARAERAACRRRAIRFANDSRLAASQPVVRVSEHGVGEGAQPVIDDDDDDDDDRQGSAVSADGDEEEKEAKWNINTSSKHDDNEIMDAYLNEVRVEDDKPGPITSAVVTNTTTTTTTTTTTNDDDNNNNDTSINDNKSNNSKDCNHNTNVSTSVGTDNAVRDDGASGSASQPCRVVQSGDRVRLHYQLLDGKSMRCLEASNSNEPLELTVGDGSVVHGLEIGLLGATCGLRRRIAIPSRLAYGDGDVVIIVTVIDIIK